METITSRDGTRIAYYRRGAGPPLVLVHGTGAANPLAWTGVIPTLEEHFTIYAMDRRGRGGSGDSNSYAIEREFEDIVAVVDVIGEPAYVLGHSFGALLALEAALLTPNIRKLVLYEAAIPLPGVPNIPEDYVDQLQALLDAGDREQVLITHYGEVMTPDQIELFKSSPAWPSRLASAHTVPRELREGEHYRFDAQRFKALQTPTLLLVGSDSPQSSKEGDALIDAALPNSRIAILPGQEHIAMYTAPALFLQEVLAFLLGTA